MLIPYGLSCLIGRTPIYELKKIESKYNCFARIAAKLEFMLPGGSIKDRTAYFMLTEAEIHHKIDKNSVIIVPTSGNTGISFSMLCAASGRRCIIVMPDTMSHERRKFFTAYGAELVLTPGEYGMQGAVDEANRLAASIPGGYLMSQFDSLANLDAHHFYTGVEILDDTENTVDVLVAAVGSGGTATGTAMCLKKYKPGVEIFAVEPENSAVLSGEEPGPHRIQGIGAGFISKITDPSLFDGIITVSDEEAYIFCRELARTEGLLCGISSGAALAAAVKLAKEEEYEGKLIVTILPDSGDRYLSCEGLFD